MSCSRRSAIGATATLIFTAALSQQIGVAAAEEPSSEEAVVPVRFFPGKGGKAGLVIFFDGDGQALHDTDGGDGEGVRGGLSGSGSVAGPSTAYGYDVISIRAPGEEGSWRNSGQGGVDYVKTVVHDVAAEHGSNTKCLWFAGYASGSDFITQTVFPAFAEDLEGGGLIVFAGGDSPSETLVFSERIKSSLSLNWITGRYSAGGGSGDLDRARRGIKYYKEAGFKNVWKEISHDNHVSVIRVFGHYVNRRLLAYAGKR